MAFGCVAVVADGRRGRHHQNCFNSPHNHNKMCELTAVDVHNTRGRCNVMKFDGDYICSYDTVDGSLDVDQLIS